MQAFLDFLNNNSGLVALLGVVVGWLLSSSSERRLYKRQKNDELEKERRERFKEKAELAVNESFRVNGDNVKELDVIPCPYTAFLDDNNLIETKISKIYSNKNKLCCKVFYLENIGKSDINELEVAIADPKNVALLNGKTSGDFIKNGHISYGVMLDRKIRVGEAVELCIYYDKKMPISDIFSASIEVYFRDSLGNICAQPLFITERKMYEPQSIDYSEWRDQVSVEKNLEHWKRRLHNR